jgi:hypothetical protein
MYRQFVKKLDLPSGFEAPTRLTYEDVVAAALTRAHLADDVRGISASIELIQSTRGGGWPTEPVTEEFNFVDLVWHEQEFREGTSFAYAVYDDRDQYLGCCYLYPMGRRTELTETLLRPALGLRAVAKPVESDAENVLDVTGLGAWHLRDAGDEVQDVGEIDVVADDARVLGAFQYWPAGFEQPRATVLEQRGVGIEVVEELAGQCSLRGEVGDEALEPLVERAPRVGIVEVGR